jgi:hypothetical protein
VQANRVNGDAPAEKSTVEATSADYVVGHRIRDMDEDERPRECLLKFGPAALSNAELVAVLLGMGRQGENAGLLEQ